MTGNLETEAASLIVELTALRREMREFEAQSTELLQSLHPAHERSGRNLAHYLALRRHDIRPLQRRLAELGLSSLGRAESHVLAAVDSVLRALRMFAGQPAPASDGPAPVVGFEEGDQLLRAHTDVLLGSRPAERGGRIMVTMPPEAADPIAGPALIRRFLECGMNCLRINCAHDDAPAWSRMIAHLRQAESQTGIGCRVLMDLAGPKLRTGPVEPGPAVVKIRPRRDALGRVAAPARIWLSPREHPTPPPGPADARLDLPTRLLRKLRRGDELEFRDARDRRRRLPVVDIVGEGRWVESDKTCYVTPETRLRVRGRPHVSTVDPLERPPRKIPLAVGDTIVLTRALAPGSPAVRSAGGELERPAFIGCTLPELFASARAGERILFDDGSISGVIEAVDPDRATVRITQAPPGGGRLGAEKGINVPDTELDIPALTAKDLDDLVFVAAHADIVGLSFVRSAEDVESLQGHLQRLKAGRLGIILKIETVAAFGRLPELLHTVMRSPRAGIMIARGDLAVECGYERLAEVQEEILWICEAAHIPAVWATQVLENLAKAGLPSRAEITDAAMGVRAECVMLNKGPRMPDAIATLDDILRRMESHQAKKTPMLRRLRSWTPET